MGNQVAKYKVAFETFLAGGIDHESISRWLVVNHPSVFLKACGQSGQDLKFQKRKQKLQSHFHILTLNQCDELLKIKDKFVRCEIDKVPAIKEVRTISGLGLKEAKDFVEGFYE